MNKQILLVAALILIGYVLVRYYVSIHGTTNNVNNLIQSGNIVSPTPALTFTPTPITFDQNSNLEQELEKLTPEDFTQDFNNLKSF